MHGIRTYAAASANRTHTPTPRTAGFTLIEIILVVGILGILFVLLITGISDFAERQSFNSVVTDVRDGVIEMRQRTLSSENDTLYGIHVSSTSFTLFEGSAYVFGDPDNTVIEFPGSVTATSSLSGGVTSATFTRLTGIPSATGTITIEDTTSGEQATVTISGTGLVE